MQDEGSTAARTSVAGLIARFLSLGVVALGGATAQLVMMRAEHVDREKWVTPERLRPVLGCMWLTWKSIVGEDEEVLPERS